MGRTLLSLCLAAILAFCAHAYVPFAEAPDIFQTAGIYYAYPERQHAVTSPPSGYSPFYISHYGRHGSRWITDDSRYTVITSVFDTVDSIGGLTELGKDVHRRLHRVTADAIGRSGHLTPLGERQHRCIADRMINTYPEVFADSAFVRAVSSTGIRCIMSMGAFTERLKEVNPSINITRSAYDKDMKYIAYTSPEGKVFTSEDAPWREGYREYVAEIVNPERLMGTLFEHPESFSPAQMSKIMTDLYWIASDMQNVDLEESFYDIFQYDELNALWRTINARMYLCNANAPGNGGIMPRCASNLLRQIVADADSAMKDGTAANLRFGHDTHLLRLLSLMELPGCTNEECEMEHFHLAWRDYHLSPMAANIQLIFFRNEAGQVLVKILLNEDEVFLPVECPTAPFYPWNDLRGSWLEKSSTSSQ